MTSRFLLLAMAAAATVAAAACRPADSATPIARAAVPESAAAAAAQQRRLDSLRRIPGYVVDSFVPMPEALRRFQSATPGPAPEQLTGGDVAPEALLTRLVTAYSAGDTAALGALTVDRAEFAYLYYPESPYPERGYELSADFVWYLMETHGAKGIERAGQRLAGRHWRVLGVDCGATPSVEGANRVWGPCAVSLAGPGGEETTLALAKAVLERDGRFKLLGLENGI